MEKESNKKIKRKLAFIFIFILILTGFYIFYDHVEKDFILEMNVIPQNIIPNCPQCHEMQSIWDHRSATPSEVCKRCHEGVVLENKMSELECLGCHFLKKSHEIGRMDCLYCHQPGISSFPSRLGRFLKSIPQEHLPDRFSCDSCHKPHKDEVTMNCEECHDVSEMGLHSVMSNVQCTTCHKPHTFLVLERQICESCHVNMKNHYEGKLCVECHEFGGGIRR